MTNPTDIDKRPYDFSNPAFAKAITMLNAMWDRMDVQDVYRAKMERQAIDHVATDHIQAAMDEAAGAYIDQKRTPVADAEVAEILAPVEHLVAHEIPLTKDAKDKHLLGMYIRQKCAELTAAEEENSRAAYAHHIINRLDKKIALADEFVEAAVEYRKGDRVIGRFRTVGMVFDEALATYRAEQGEKGNE